MNKKSLQIFVSLLFVGYFYYVTNQELSGQSHLPFRDEKTIFPENELLSLKNQNNNHNPLLQKEKDYQKKFLNINEDFFIYADLGP